MTATWATAYKNHAEEIAAMQAGTWHPNWHPSRTVQFLHHCSSCPWPETAAPTPKLTFATIGTDQRWRVVAKAMQLQGCISRHDYYPVCEPGKRGPVGAVLDTERAGRWQAAAVRLMFYAAGKR